MRMHQSNHTPHPWQGSALPRLDWHLQPAHMPPWKAATHPFSPIYRSPHAKISPSVVTSTSQVAEGDEGDLAAGCYARRFRTGGEAIRLRAEQRADAGAGVGEARMREKPEKCRARVGFASNFDSLGLSKLGFSLTRRRMSVLSNTRPRGMGIEAQHEIVIGRCKLGMEETEDMPTRP